MRRPNYESWPIIMFESARPLNTGSAAGCGKGEQKENCDCHSGVGNLQRCLPSRQRRLETHHTESEVRLHFNSPPPPPPTFNAPLQFYRRRFIDPFFSFTLESSHCTTSFPPLPPGPAKSFITHYSTIVYLGAMKHLLNYLVP
jgi:hypothetical protein